MKEISVTVDGKVQGVGFRAYTKKQAKKLGLDGWVKNKPDGTVEVIAQGKKDELETFVEHLKSGPYFAEVENFKIDWHDKLQDQLNDFVVEA